jgi:hypothetical protein
MLTGTAAAKVLTSQQNASTFVARLIENKVWVDGTRTAILTRLTMIELAPFIKQILTEPSLLD